MPNWFFSIVFLCLTFCTCCVQAQIPAPALNSISRTAAKVGETFDLNVFSAQTEVRSLYFSHPGITWSAKTSPPDPFSTEPTIVDGQFAVTVAADVPPSLYQVRVAGRHGVTNPRSFLVSSVDCEVVIPSHLPQEPTNLLLGRMMFAKSTPAEVDHYKLQVNEGQSIQIQIIAQQLDSRMIGQVKLYDHEGRLVASQRGTDAVDPIIKTDSLPAGEYGLWVHDFLFRGGDDFHYQLLAQDSNSGIEPIAQPHPTLISSCSIQGQQFALPSDSPLPDIIPIPSETSGWFTSEDTVFQFHANQGEPFSIDVVSERLGEPTDARMLVQRIEPQESATPKLHDVLNVDDSQEVGDAALHLRSKDPVAMFTVPATADYQLTLRDLDIGQTISPRQSFLLRVRQPTPGFDLVVYRSFPNKDVNQTQPLGSYLMRGGSESIRVLANRRDGWSGPIRITIENLPAAVTCGEAIIAANQTQAELTLLASEDAIASFGKIDVVGASEDGSIKQTAIPATILWGRGGGRDFIRSRLSSELYLAVSEQDLAAITISLGESSVPEVKKGESLKIPIKLTRARVARTIACCDPAICRLVSLRAKSRLRVIRATARWKSRQLLTLRPEVIRSGCNQKLKSSGSQTRKHCSGLSPIEPTSKPSTTIQPKPRTSSPSSPPLRWRTSGSRRRKNKPKSENNSSSFPPPIRPFESSIHDATDPSIRLPRIRHVNQRG